jgi:hypothetical protein
MAVPEAEQLVWHYTDADGLLGMIKHRQAWATHFKFLNDFKEGWFLGEPLTDFLENDEKLTASQRSFIEVMLGPYLGQPFTKMTNVPDGNHFLFCGSTSGDELTLWRNYAKDAISFAVGLDPQVPLGVIPPKGDIASTNHEVYAWQKVEYHSSTTSLPAAYGSGLRSAVCQENMGDQLVDVSDQLTRLCSTVKTSAFEDERESRIVCVANDTRLWRFRVGRYGLTPYVALGASDSWGVFSTGDDPLPIRAIRLSSNATSSDHLALNALLENHGFRGDAVVEEIFDDSGEHIDSHFEEYEPPIRLLQSDNSLRQW